MNRKGLDKLIKEGKAHIHIPKDSASLPFFDMAKAYDGFLSELKRAVADGALSHTDAMEIIAGMESVLVQLSDNLEKIAKKHSIDYTPPLSLQILKSK